MIPRSPWLAEFEVRQQALPDRTCVKQLSLVCPARSAARNEKRMEALRECVRMITASAGGCTTPFPFEAAIWLLEEQEELYGGSIPIYNSVSCKLRE